MADYDDLYMDADDPIMVSEEPMPGELTENEIQRLRGLTTDDFFMELESMSPDKRAEVEAIFFNNTDTDLVEEQMSYARELRGTEMPGGRTTRNNIFTAANPLEFASPVMDRLEGREMYEKSTQSWEDILKQQAEARKLASQQLY